jgi:hypothetical protein
LVAVGSSPEDNSGPESLQAHRTANVTEGSGDSEEKSTGEGHGPTRKSTRLRVILTFPRSGGSRLCSPTGRDRVAVTGPTTYCTDCSFRPTARHPTRVGRAFSITPLAHPYDRFAVGRHTPLFSSPARGKGRGNRDLAGELPRSASESSADQLEPLRQDDADLVGIDRLLTHASSRSFGDLGG